MSALDRSVAYYLQFLEMKPDSSLLQEGINKKQLNNPWLHIGGLRMSKTGLKNVTMRVRIGDAEVEVTGPQNFVEQKIEQFISGQRRSHVPASPGEQGKPKDPTPSRKDLAPAQFFRGYDLETDVDRVLVAGYFLEKVRNQDDFTSAEVTQTIRAAKIAPPQNPSDAIAKNIKKGHIMSSGDREKKMAFVLTTDGEEIVGQMVRKQDG